jgi:hypothetical protein
MNSEELIADPPPIPDNAQLIGGAVWPLHPVLSGVGVFIVLKFVTALFGVLVFFWADYPTPSSFLLLTAAFCEFWLCKNCHGLQLVGMRWSHEIGDRGDPHWVFYSRRDPYVPEPLHASVFWSGLFAACVVWGLASLAALFVTLFKPRVFDLSLYAFAFGLELVNMSCFLKCHRVSTWQADDVARSVLLMTELDSDEVEPDQQQPQQRDEAGRKERE